MINPQPLGGGGRDHSPPPLNFLNNVRGVAGIYEKFDLSPFTSIACQYTKLTKSKTQIWDDFLEKFE